jgi:CheY-like chemotaxis protein
VTVLALAATLVATLTPIPGNVVSFSFWCITCGELGSLDFAANVIMFMPLGLGLALVKSLTQLHGGTVTAESDGPGRGSRFTVTLPPHEDAPTHHTDNLITKPIAAIQPPSGRVLVVDDNADAADTLADILRGVGYEDAVAHDAPQALDLAHKFCPSIALLDIGLPVMDGYELARHLREQLPTTPRLVAVSGYGHDADLARSRAAGFDVHLGKPVAMDVLVNVLSSLPST